MSTLEDRQLLMKQKFDKEKAEKEAALANRPKCIACKRRYARQGQAYCSRCTATDFTNDLRDVLPGAITAAMDTLKCDTPELREQYRTGTLPPSIIVFEAPPVREEPQGFISSESQIDLKTVTYTRSQASEIIGVSPTTLLRWEKKGRIPMPARLVHTNHVLYTEEIIKAAVEYKNQQYVAPTTSSDTIQNPHVFNPKNIKLSRKIERTVANRMGNLGRRLM